MIVVVAALKQEVSGYIRRHRLRPAGRLDGAALFETQTGRNTAVVLSGVGKTQARRAAELAIDRYSPDVIISAGFSGGAVPGLATGDVVVCGRVMAASSSDPTALDRSAEPIEMPGQPDQVCLTVPRLAHDPESKRMIGQSLPVTVIDMESYWVAETAAQRGAPVRVVRSILDAVDDTLPDFVYGLAGRGWPAALGLAFRKPSTVPEVARLARKANTASRALSAALAALADGEIANDNLNMEYSRTHART